MPTSFYPIGTPGQAWGPADVAQWRARQVRQRSHAADVLAAVDKLRSQWDVAAYGHLACAATASQPGTAPVPGPDTYPLVALRSRGWHSSLPTVLVTGGVHGYETSGVHGALRFAAQHAAAYAGRFNLLVVPCVSPWGYERVQRWNADAIDPNRSFCEHSPAPEAAALMQLVAPLRGQIAAHIDLHETTQSDETEFRPAVVARDGKPFVPGTIPDGFYLVADGANPQLAFQQAIIEAVERVTHIAPADGQGSLIGSPLVARGVIAYDVQALGLCTGITGARYTTTTEVYPDSPRATPEQCIAAQVAAVCAALAFLA
ncbi:MAG: M14 family metallocarboxypeptidase [Burkholderiales bacterium]|nr:M14 family metallocarboxypeptidase [Burkholderiales bacterium]